MLASPADTAESPSTLGCTGRLYRLTACRHTAPAGDVSHSELTKPNLSVGLAKILSGLRLELELVLVARAQSVHRTYLDKVQFNVEAYKVQGTL